MRPSGHVKGARKNPPARISRRRRPNREPGIMGQVTSLFARKVVEEVADGLDKDALLRTVDSERAEPVDPS